MAEVTIVEVSPRDGFQNDPKLISTEDKVEHIKKLVEAGFDKIEVTSFVHPKKVPQMADAEDVLGQIKHIIPLKKIALIPNERGYERAAKSHVDEVNWVSAATDTFNQKNIGMTIEDNDRRFFEVRKRAKEDQIQFNYSIAVAFGCPYEGGVSEEQVLRQVEKAVDQQVDRITIADTIGYAIPSQVESLMKKVVDMAAGIPVAIHLHDTRGFGLANAYAAYKQGVTIFETAVSGIGGCPFAPGAAGNLATEDLVYMFERMGVKTGLDFEKMIEAADFAAKLTTNKALGRIRHIERKFL